MRKRIAFTVTWKRLVGTVVVLAVLGFGYAWSGLVPIRASSGHFPPWAWFLHWTMQNAAQKQSLGISVPEDIDLTDPALIKRAAGHFAGECAPCHGSPAEPQSPVIQSMTPAPPRLAGTVGDYADRELFWIVKHGIKYTGMPAWPSQERDDEIWAQVAFLKALPSMSTEDYQRYAYGEEATQAVNSKNQDAANATFENALADCSRCHGKDGRGAGPTAAFPILAGQPADYLFATLQAFSYGTRESGFMEPPAKRYDAAILKRLADYYAEQPHGSSQAGAADCPAVARALASDDPEPHQAASQRAIPPTSGPREPLADAKAAAESEAPLDLGRTLARDGLPERKIPACESCHGETGHVEHPDYPYLAGQPKWYLSTHLHLWKDGTRGGTSYANVMDKIADQMSDKEIEAAALWYSQQEAAGTN
ncbi:c-type cytochrome [Consotaella aegiceratis]|uniref:c-type cytochrome n=1 Tax=Consotaella aegiceratis TaxID=3097961 RepID=UPI002F41F4C8